MTHFDRVKASIGAIPPTSFDASEFEVGKLSEPDLKTKNAKWSIYA